MDKMAQDIIPLDPIKDKCPWCGKPVLIEHSLAVHDGGDTEQYDGIKRDENPPDAERIPRLLRRRFPLRRRLSSL
jgi:hypothetical protein